MANVRVINTATQRVENFQTDAINFGELKEDLLTNVEAFEDFDFRNSTCVVKTPSGRNTVSLSDEAVPSEDFKLYITPKQVKQGAKAPYSISKLREIRTYLIGLEAFLTEIIGDEGVVDLEEEVNEKEVDENELTDEELREIEELSNL